MKNVTSVSFNFYYACQEHGKTSKEMLPELIFVASRDDVFLPSAMKKRKKINIFPNCLFPNEIISYL